MPFRPLVAMPEAERPGASTLGRACTRPNSALPIALPGVVPTPPGVRPRPPVWPGLAPVRCDTPGVPCAPGVAPGVVPGVAPGEGMSLVAKFRNAVVKSPCRAHQSREHQLVSPFSCCPGVPAAVPRVP